MGILIQGYLSPGKIKAESLRPQTHLLVFVDPVHSQPPLGASPCPSSAAESAVSREPELREEESRELPSIDLQWEQEGWKLSAYNNKSVWNTEML